MPLPAPISKLDIPISKVDIAGTHTFFSGYTYIYMHKCTNKTRPDKPITHELKTPKQKQIEGNKGALKATETNSAKSHNEILTSHRYTGINSAC